MEKAKNYLSINGRPRAKGAESNRSAGECGFVLVDIVEVDDNLFLKVFII